MMTAEKLEKLSALAEGETSMERVALDGLSNRLEIRRRLQLELEKHIRAKEGFEGLVKRIQKVTQYDASRAKRIALTERTRSANGSRYSQAIKEYLNECEKARKQHRKRPDAPRFQWVHPNIAKEPRHSHIAISGDVKAIGEEFLPGLKYPGDPEAPASQVINCHCYIRRVRR